MDRDELYSKMTPNREAWLGLGDSERRRLLCPLRFKTGGLRGVMREGFGGINAVTCDVLASVLCKRYDSIVIGYDHRLNSEYFAQIIAAVFALAGKKTAVYRHCVTPYLALESEGYGVGVMVTASHNSKEYNGFKVYVKGAQIREPLDKELERDMLEHPFVDFWDSKREMGGISDDPPYRRPAGGPSLLDDIRGSWASNLRRIDYQKYFKSFNLKLPEVGVHKVTPFFSALFGVSGPFVSEACKFFGIKIDLGDVQNEPNAEFPGTEHPNPENASNYLPVFSRHDASVVFMCDPDGDRFGLAVSEKNQSGEASIRIYNGDEIAKIFTFWFIRTYPHEELCLVNTFLCSNFFNLVSERLKIPHRQVETGFKNVSKAVCSFLRGQEGAEPRPVVIAYEDPLGFLLGSGNEKDGIKAAVLMYFILQEYDLNEIFLDMEAFGTCNTHTVHIRVEDPKAVLCEILEPLNCAVESDRHALNLADFRVIFRISGTESLIKIYTASDTLRKEELVEKADQWILQNIRSKINQM